MTTTALEPDAELLARAQAYKQDAVELLFNMNYPVVWRMAHGLTGREDVARGVVKFVMKRALKQLPYWKDEGAPARWFQHHTVLASRRTGKHPPTLANDVLVTTAETRNAAYPAFVRAVRTLPLQQREAFILHHGERMNLRYLAVAMDCSTQAAGTHLNAATDQLRTVSREFFDEFTQQLARCYARTTPSEQLIVPSIRAQYRRYIWPRKIARTIAWLMLLSILALAGYLAWKIVPLIET
jgi:DNA-directed RNA polymerase specialized sigma24 family protein